MAASPACAPVTRDADGGVVMGIAPGGEPVTVPFRTAARGTRCAVIGDPALPMLMAKRALDAGARVRVVTGEPEDWLRLRAHAGPYAERLVIVGAAAPPPDDRPDEPSMVIDDTGLPAGEDVDAGSSPPPCPSQALVVASSARVVPVAALRGLDAIVLYRSSPACRGAVVAALRLPETAVRPLHGIPSDVVALVSAEAVRLVPLRASAAECALFTELGLPIWPARDCWPMPGLASAARAGATRSDLGADVT